MMKAVTLLSEYLVENGDLVFYNLSQAVENVSLWLAKSVGVSSFELGLFGLPNKPPKNAPF